MSRINISELRSADIQKWNQFVDQSLLAKIYHRAEWQSLIKDVFGHDSVYLQALDEHGQIVGILPIVKMESKLFGRFAVSMPYFNYGGAVGNDVLIETLMMQKAREYFDNSRLDFIEFRDEKPRDGFPGKQEKITMILPLMDDPEAMFNSYKAKIRSQIKRPLRDNVNIIFGGEEYLNEFYEAFTTNMRDLGTPPYTKHFFAEILRRFPENAYLAIARKDNEVAGAAFLLGYKDMLEIPWASTVRKFNPLGVNMLMYWEVIRSAIEKGYKYFDFGRCSRDSGTHRFKKQWGAEEKQLYWHYELLKLEELPQINPKNSKYTLFIDTWKKLPLSVTKLIGPHIVKNIP